MKENVNNLENLKKIILGKNILRSLVTIITVVIGLSMPFMLSKKYFLHHHNSKRFR